MNKIPALLSARAPGGLGAGEEKMQVEQPDSTAPFAPMLEITWLKRVHLQEVQQKSRCFVPHLAHEE